MYLNTAQLCLEGMTEVKKTDKKALCSSDSYCCYSDLSQLKA